MCTMSMVGDYWMRETPLRFPQTFPGTGISPTVTGVSRQEFDALKRDVEELKALLVAAKRYDEATGQRDCETDEKVALIKRVAEMVGVDLGDVFGKPATT